MEELQRSPKVQDIIEDKNVQWKRTEEKEPEYSVILQSPITVWLGVSKNQRRASIECPRATNQTSISKCLPGQKMMASSLYTAALTNSPIRHHSPSNR